MAEINDLIPKDKFDTSSIDVLMTLNDDAIEPLIPKLLIWIQDMNWPVAPHVIKVLAKHCKVTEKYILSLLKPEQKDDIWKYNIIRYLLYEWPSFPDDELITSEIIRISERPTEGEKEELVDEAALKYLNDHG